MGKLVFGPNKAGQEICEVLKLDPAMTHSIDIHLAIGDVATMKVGTYLSERDAALIKPVFTEYKLVPIKGNIKGPEPDKDRKRK